MQNAWVATIWKSIYESILGVVEWYKVSIIDIDMFGVGMR